MSVCPPGFVVPPAGEPRKLPAAELVERLALLSENAQAAQVERLSLGGFQDKVALTAASVQVRNGFVVEADWALPDAATVSTHILKPQPRAQYANLAEGEAWAMTVARHAARCSKIALLDLEGAPSSRKPA